MTVRGTTAWRHAILQKKVINHDRGGTYVMCAWDTCERDGYEMYKAIEHQSSASGGDVTFVFCSERHKQYFLHSTVRANDLPPGYKKSIV
jgi:hypothetical protein